MSFLISVLGLTTVAFLAAGSPEPAPAVVAAEPAALPQVDMANA